MHQIVLKLSLPRPGQYITRTGAAARSEEWKIYLPLNLIGKFQLRLSFSLRLNEQIKQQAEEKPTISVSERS